LSFQLSLFRFLTYPQATATLDQVTEARFQRVISTQLHAATIVCIAHRLENFRWCNLRIEMSQGKVVAITNLSS
jgi:ABC-type multidrug transport system fused ATPase/permease subunit